MLVPKIKTGPDESVNSMSKYTEDGPSSVGRVGTETDLHQNAGDVNMEEGLQPHAGTVSGVKMVRETQLISSPENSTLGIVPDLLDSDDEMSAECYGKTQKQDEMIKELTEEFSQMSVRQVTYRAPGMTYLIPITVERRKIKSVMDTGSQACLMSYAVFKSLNCKKAERILVHNAQKNSWMDGYEVPGFRFMLGGKHYSCNMAVSDIEDDLILGLDFLKREARTIDLENDCIVMKNGDTIHAVVKIGEDGERYQVSRVILRKKCSVAPRSFRFAQAKLENPAGVSMVLEPRQTGSLLLIPSLVKGDSTAVKVAMVNLGNEKVSIPRGQLVAQAIEAESAVEVDEEGKGEYIREKTPEEFIEFTKSVTRRSSLAHDVNAVADIPIEVAVDNIKEEPPDSSQDRPGEVAATGSGYSTSSHDGNHLPNGRSGDQGLSTGSGCTTSPHDGDHMSSRDWTVRPDTELLPVHMRAMFDDALSRLTNEEGWKLLDVLVEYQDVFASNDLDIGEFKGLMHWINTGDGKPKRQGMRRTPLGFEAEEKKVLDAMHDAGVIEPSQSEWASPPVLVRKKDNGWRYCIDFRYLNSVTVKDAYPLPLIDECIDSLTGKEWYCGLDMNSGYWQIPIAEEDREKTAFITKYGLFQFVRMPFGLSNAPATFQRSMHVVLAGLIWECVIVYLDDINVLGDSFDDTLSNLVRVLKRFRAYGLKLKPRKCALFKKEVAFLGRIVSREGVRLTEQHLEDIKNWPIPKCRKEVEAFLGFINYHRRFLIGLAGKTRLLYELTGRKAVWKWTPAHREAFEELKKAMVEAPVLGLPTKEGMFILDTDASDFAVGAELSQMQEGEERPLAYSSKIMNKAQQKFRTTKEE